MGHAGLTAGPAGPGGLAPVEVEDWQRVAAGFLLAYTGASRSAYATDLRGYLTWCAAGGLDPLEATRAHVDAYAETLRTAGAAPATIARRLAALSGFYAYAVDEGLLERSPVTRVRRPTVGEHAVSTGLAREELTVLVAAAEADGPRSLVVVLLLGLNGLRVSEVCTATADGLFTERGHRVLAITRKGGRTARVPLAPRTAAAVETYLSGRATGPLLVTRTGAAMDRHAIWRLLRRLAATAVPDKAASIHPHDLRHAFVTLALDTGASLRDVQDAAGHADPRTTRRYDRARHNLDRHPTYALATYLH
jgi:site-specific recombinase XerD